MACTTPKSEAGFCATHLPCWLRCEEQESYDARAEHLLAHDLTSDVRRSAALSRECHQALAAHACAVAHGPCDLSGRGLQHRSWAAEAAAACFFEGDEQPRRGLAEGSSSRLLAELPSEGQGRGCPRGFVIPDDPNRTNLHYIIEVPNTTTCAAKCPLPVYTDDEFHTIIVTQWTWSVVSLVSVIFICLTWACFEEKRKQRVILFIALFSLCLAGVFIVVNAYGTYETWCYDNASDNLQSDGGLCVASAVLIMFFVLQLVGWSFFQAFHLYLLVVRLQKNIQHYWRYYAVPITLVATACPVALGAQGLIGFTDSLPVCFITFELSSAIAVGSSPSPWTQDLFWFFLPVITYMLGGIVLMIRVIWRVHAATADAEKRGQRIRRSPWMLYRQSLFFVTVQLGSWVVLFVFRALLLANQNDFVEGFELWALCTFLVYRITPGVDYIAFCGETPPDRFSLGFMCLFLTILVGQGFLTFIMFIGSRPRQNFELWRAAIERGCERCSRRCGLLGGSKEHSEYYYEIDPLVREAGGDSPLTNSPLSSLSAGSGYPPSPNIPYTRHGVESAASAVPGTAPFTDGRETAFVASLGMEGEVDFHDDEVSGLMSGESFIRMRDPSAADDGSLPRRRGATR